MRIECKKFDWTRNGIKLLASLETFQTKSNDARRTLPKPNWLCCKLELYKDSGLQGCDIVVGWVISDVSKDPRKRRNYGPLQHRDLPIQEHTTLSPKPESPVAPLWQPRMLLWSHMRTEALMLSRYICILWTCVRGNITSPIPVAQYPPLGRSFLIIEASRSHSVTQHSVGLLWMSDQLVTDTSTWWHTTLNIGIRAPAGGIRSCSPSKRAAANPRLRSHGHLDLQLTPWHCIILGKSKALKIHWGFNEYILCLQADCACARARVLWIRGKFRFHVIIRLAAGCSKLHHLKNEDVI